MTGNVAAQGIVDVHCHNILPFYLEREKTSFKQ